MNKVVAAGVVLLMLALAAASLVNMANLSTCQVSMSPETCYSVMR